MSIAFVDRPTTNDIEAATSRFARHIAAAYSHGFKGLFLFGSRSRGDHCPASDVDIAVVLSDVGFDFWTEKLRLSDIAYDTVIETGVDVQGWPVRHSEWSDPAVHGNPSLVRAQ